MLYGQQQVEQTLTSFPGRQWVICWLGLSKVPSPTPLPCPKVKSPRMKSQNEAPVMKPAAMWATWSQSTGQSHMTIG